jgi:glycolate oxidase FAD binding subunit
MARPSLESITRAAVDLWGEEGVRPACGADEVDGCAPLAVLEPSNAATLAEMLGWANAQRLAVVPRGAGTKLHWGTAPLRVDVVLSTARLEAPVEHCAGDLTATVPAGLSLAAVNEIIGRERQWLALDPAASDRATIGGIIATNDSGPRRQKHGTPRDLIIGVEMALVDGRMAKAGGRVVKNVAGYDLSRLLCGSFGTLAVITNATFKLTPSPPTSRTIVATAHHARGLADLALAIAAAPLTPSAIELQSPPPGLLIRFETTEAAADRQAAAALKLCRDHGADASTVVDEAEDAVWQGLEARLSPTNGTLVRIAVLPTHVADMLEHVERVSARHSIDYRAGGRAALGVLFCRLGGSDETAPTSDREKHAAAVEDLRRNARAGGGSAVIISAAPAVKAHVDPWGEVGDALPMMRAVKTRFDPNGILNPGRGAGGI